MSIACHNTLAPIALCILIGLAGAIPATASVDYSDLLGNIPTVVTAHEAFAILPPELIAAPTVSKIASSPDLRYLLVVRQENFAMPTALKAIADGADLPPVLESELILWDSLTYESHEVLRLSAEQGAIRRVEWMPGSDMALVMIQPLARSIGEGMEGSPRGGEVLRVDAASAKAELLVTGSPSTDYVGWTMSATQPLAVLERHDSTLVTGANRNRQEIAETFTGVGAAGPLGPPAVLPPGMEALPHWMEDGSLVLTTLTIVPGQPGVKATYTLDSPTGKLRNRKPLDKTEEPATIHPATPATAAELTELLPVTLETTKAQLNDGQTAGSVNMLWLQAAGVKPVSRALVGLEATNWYILPDAHGIVYQMKGAEWVSPVVRMNAGQYGNVWRSAQRKIIASRAKQLGTAIIMWSQDNDEKYPTPDDIKAKLMPYIKDDGVFNGFVYTYTGGDLADIEAPAETVLGYVPGPGGQATLYADGHVKWQTK